MEVSQANCIYTKNSNIGEQERQNKKFNPKC